MPYPNEHSCRINDPKKYDKVNRVNCEQKHDDKCIDVIYGIKEGKSEIQALRYKKDVWTADAAKSHCQSRDGTFEAASEEDSINVKSLRGVISYHDYGAADENDSWDGPKEIASAEVEDLKKICAWYDAEDAENKGAYKLPHHRVSDKKAVWAGVRAAMGALLGARGGVDIPDGDRRGVYNHLAKHYKHWDKEAPAFRNIDSCERRYITLDEEFRFNEDENILEGYAARFNVWSENLGFFKEKIKRGAFTKTIEEGDIRALFNHDPNYILGRTKNGTLELEEDNKGLYYKVKLPDTTYARDLKESIRRGDITQNSFGFQALKDDWNEKGDERTLLEVKLFDISPVTYPAYPQTTLKLRDLFGEFGIDYEKLESIMKKANRGTDLQKEEIEFLEYTIDTFRSLIPTEESVIEEPPAEEHSETHSEDEIQEPDYSTLIRLRLLDRKVKNILGVK